MRRSWIVPLVVLLFALSASPAAALVGATIYRGTIYPLGPVEAGGEAYIPASQAYQLVWTSRADFVAVNASTLVAHVDEWRWTAASPAASREPPPEGPSGSVRTGYEEVFEEARVEVVELRSRNEIRLSSTTSGQSVLAYGLRDCTLSLSTLGLVRKAETPIIAADCRAQRLEPTLLDSGVTTVRVDEADVLVKGESLRTGMFSERVVEAGLTVTRNDTTLLYDYLLRRLTLEVRPVETTTLVVEPQSVRFLTPLLQWSGRIVLPSFLGELTVGDSTLRNSTRPTELRGTTMLLANGYRDGLPGMEVAGGSAFTPFAKLAPAPEPNQPILPTVVAVAATSLLAGAVAWLARRAFLALPLFSRLTAATALQHEARRLILDFINENPGVRVHQIIKRLRLPQSTILHHVKILVQQGLVVREKEGRKVLLFPPSASGRRVLALEQDATLRRMLASLRRGDVVGQKALAEEVGVSQSYVSRVMRRLEERGVVRKRRLASGFTYDLVPG